MEMRPGLRRVYAVGAFLGDMRMLGSIGFAVLDDPVAMGDVRYHGLGLRWCFARRDAADAALTVGWTLSLTVWSDPGGASPISNGGPS